MTNNSIVLLSDRELLDATRHMVERESRTTAELLALLAELDARKLHLSEGYSSLFTYCTQALHLSEPAAYSRITAARAARRFPGILALLAEGAVTLTSVGLLAPHLTDENHDALLDAARHKSKRDVERLIACLHPQPDIPSSVRKLPALPGPESDRGWPVEAATLPAVDEPPLADRLMPAPPGWRPGLQTRRVGPSRPLVASLAAETYLVRITISRETHRKLERARDLLRHTVPNGDPAAILDRALTVLVEQLERTKLAATSRPRREYRKGDAPKPPGGRHIPAAVKRSVWARDEGRCAFVGTQGRCAETGLLEFHHVTPFAAGGATDVDNLQLRCRAHNGHEADVYLGQKRRQRVVPAPAFARCGTAGESMPEGTTLAGQS
jgi:5-methylcytosine-specific restriction endonuclease McrA